MSLKVPDVGELLLLNVLTGQAGATNISALTCFLYSNNYTPVDGSVVGDFTEANFGDPAVNQARKTLSAWTAASTTGDSHAQSTAAAMTYTNTSGAAKDVYGYWVGNVTKTNLYFAERFAGAPLNIPNNTALILTPNFTLISEF